MAKHILLMDGPDAKGLIFHVTSVLYRNECNIISQDEYVSPPADGVEGQFFMRTEFESPDKLDPQKILKDLQDTIATPAINLRINPKKKKDVVILATKEHHCLSDLLIRYNFDELDANVLAVLSNYNTLQPFVSKFGIPFHYITHEHKTRDEHEQAILRTLEIYKPEYLVLAKYMRILSPEFVSHYPNKIVNIHHSFLPAFIGANPYRQAYERGVKIIGATAHFVNNNLDEGPIIAQNVKDVDHSYMATDMAREGKEVEKSVLTHALKLVFNDRVFISGNRTVIL
ncbi:formyltetrahydrofolate deformylase [Emticicia oligotrophica DSM 17448]|uniref:Formyltetrahydrofolate deformylase n=1 Tax=Emticicia oligotrophica (strain DSM 17448 / CIP 109782 / MTCC 6937 / GPTSA100-15) TaxID=929562 RepID=A0ABM5N038_EMTOG|nr:formyltetrahydrofolate deformylase [Emticicia oligotrophica]AFK02801.1 formyltetrahydrofolate deformylase [Emticicia oligotrophica DSM 17448]